MQRYGIKKHKIQICECFDCGYDSEAFELLTQNEKKFTRGFREVKSEFVDQSRWYTRTRYVIQRESDKSFFEFYIDYGSTECQEDPEWNIPVYKVYEKQISVNEYFTIDKLGELNAKN